MLNKKIGKILEDTKEYLKRLEKLFTQIEGKESRKSIKAIYEKTMEDIIVTNKPVPPIVPAHFAIVQITTPATPKASLQFNSHQPSSTKAWVALTL